MSIGHGEFQIGLEMFPIRQGILPESMMGTSIDRPFEAVIKNYKRFSAIEELLSPSFGRNVYDGHWCAYHTERRDAAHDVMTFIAW